MSDDMEYRIEVLDTETETETSRWYPFNGSVCYTVGAAEKALDMAREFYTNKSKRLRIASAPEQVWTPVLTRLELAVERVQAALAARDYPDMSAISRYDGKPLLADDIRLLLDTVKEMRQ